MSSSFDSIKWQQSTQEEFWGEIAPRDHILSIYEDGPGFLNLLYGFVSGGFNARAAVVVIATAEHLSYIDEQLKRDGYDVFGLKLTDEYIPLDAEALLDQFMIHDSLDENLFFHVITNLLARAKKQDRMVRAFGEMVAILWARGLTDATFQLEALWNQYCESEGFSLFCAYPKTVFGKEHNHSVEDICCAHTRLVSGDGQSQVFYKDGLSHTHER